MKGAGEEGTYMDQCVENFPKQITDTNPAIQEAQQTPNKLSSKKPIPPHRKLTLLVIKTFESSQRK